MSDPPHPSSPVSKHPPSHTSPEVPSTSGHGAPEADPVPREARLQILQGQRDGLAETTPQQIAVLQGDVTDVDAITRGTATVAADVINEASSALVRIDVVALVSEHGQTIRYPRFRARYLLDLLFALVDSQESQTARGNAWADAQATLAQAFEAARGVRNSLLFGLEQATSGKPTLAAEVTRTRGRGGRPVAMSASLEALASLVKRWLADNERALALTAGGVSADDVTLARAAAATLEKARRGVHEFPAAGRDLPGTNLIEGRFMTELTRLYRALEVHQGVVPGLPRMPLGETLRRELRRAQAQESDLEAEDEPAPTPTPDPTLSAP